MFKYGFLPAIRFQIDFKRIQRLTTKIFGINPKYFL